MSIEEFYESTIQDVNQTYNEQLLESSSTYTYKEYVYLESVLAFLMDNGMLVGEPVSCYCNTVFKNAKVKLHAYALSDDFTQLDLVVCHFIGDERIEEITDKIIKEGIAKPGLRFLMESVNERSNFINSLEKSSDSYVFAQSLTRMYNQLKQIRLLIVTDGKTKSKFFKESLVNGKNVKVEVFDIERFYKISSEGKPRDEIVVDFTSMYGFGMPCVYVPQQSGSEYAYALTALPGEVLYTLYNKYKDRILEANVRSFLSARGKNAGIQQTIVESPTRFMAYNNGLVIVADSVVIKSNEDGTSSILQIEGLQIVNGGQTTATIFFTKLNNPSIDLGPVRVAAKIIVIGKEQEEKLHEEFIGKVARYANTQNPVKESDFLAHSAFQVKFEAMSQSIYCPDSIGRWFYERAAGSYNTFLSREGRTPARRRALTTNVIPRKRLVKKTDLGLSIATWEGDPYLACLGGEKCLTRYKDKLAEEVELIDAQYFKRRIAEYIIFYHTFYYLRGDICKQSPGVVRIYLLSLVSKKYRDKINFDQVWLNQGVSEEFKEQIQIWGKELYDWMIEQANGRQLSEYGKTLKNWEAMQQFELSRIKKRIPEIST